MKKTLKFGFGSILSAALCWLNTPAIANPAASANLGLDQFVQSLPTDIQTILGACGQQGFVDLDAGADNDGSVICLDGSRNSGVAFSDYQNSLLDMSSASFMVGIQTGMRNSQQVTPEMMAQIWGSPQGIELLRNILKGYLTQNNVLPASWGSSVDWLVEGVVERSLPLLQDAQVLSNLYGSSTQYQQVVNNFCSPQGRSISQVQQMTPGLSTLQLYAICLKESGFAEELVRQQGQMGQ